MYFVGIGYNARYGYLWSLARKPPGITYTIHAYRDVEKYIEMRRLLYRRAKSRRDLVEQEWLACVWDSYGYSYIQLTPFVQQLSSLIVVGAPVASRILLVVRLLVCVGGAFSSFVGF